MKLALCVLLLHVATPVWAQGIGKLSTGSVLGLAGKEIARLGVFSIGKNGKVDAIPFQIDEKATASGNKRWAWRAAAGNGLWENGEPLLVDLRDFGSRGSASDFEKSEQVWEIKDPNNKGYLYLSLEKSVAPRSERSYVRYQAEKDSIVTDFYEAGFQKKNPLIQNYLKIKNGSLPYNILDRFKARFKLSIKKFFDFSFHEGNIKARLVGVRSGPIRVIRRVVASKSLGPVKLIPKSTIDFYFYPSWLEVPTQIRNPIDGPKILDKKTVGISGYDFNQHILGSDFYTNRGELTLRLDGKLKINPKRISGKQLDWWSFSGLAGSMVSGITNDPKLKSLDIHPVLVVVIDLNRSAPPESQKGEVFIGFDLPYHRIPKGKYSVRVKQVFPKSFSHGSEGAFLSAARLIPLKQNEQLR